ncbi:MFS transporter [Rhizobium sp. CC-YZS058]|uniref:MFS transporter n=1 Tax=Rhizobium sp. CC-YZS058 TaxID=3042153 RepID=UPI002B05A938|nr:MFS transporter [Rhizobium sp. CC-YZS058]MEA3535212.1 MFS transporter [Rhizobium sp. CC-YZS058]
MSDPSPGKTLPVEEIHWLSLIAALAAVTTVGIAIGLGVPLLSIMMEKRGISSTLIGLNSTVAGLASMVAASFTTRLAHRFGVAPVMVFSVFMAALPALGFYFVDNFWLWFPLRIVFQSGITILFVLSEFWINATAPSHRRGLVFGIYGTVLSLGFATGPLLFSILGSEGILPFAVGAGIITLAAIPIIIARRESPIIHEMPEMHFLRYVFMVPMATAAVFVFGAVEYGGLSLFPVYGTRMGFTESQAALLLTIMGVGNLIFQIPLGLLSDHMRDRRKLLIALTVIGFVGALSLPWLALHWATLAVVLLLFGGIVSGLYTIGLSHLGSRLHGPELAAANAAFVFCYALGTVAGPQVIGTSMDLFGNQGFAWSIAGFFGLYILLSLLRLVYNPKRA